jgi:hypothetical protein
MDDDDDGTVQDHDSADEHTGGTILMSTANCERDWKSDHRTGRETIR